MYNNGYAGVSDPTLSNITFSGNSATNGGAMYNNGYAGVSDPSLSNITFSGNSATLGGAMYNYSRGSIGSSSSPTLSNVTFFGNSATNGGAMYNFSEDNYNSKSSPSLSNVIFSGNSASGDGGAMYNYGMTGTSSPSLSNVTFSGNSASSQGGAMYNRIVSLSIVTPTLNNVIMWGNTASSGSQIYNDGGASPVISYSLVQGGDSGSNSGTAFGSGTGNINADPLFVDAAGTDGITGTLDDDLRLSDGSPAIDAGDNDAVSETTDLDGNARFYDDTGITDTGNGTAPIVDMGAYERQSNTPIDIAVLGQGQTIVNGDTSPSTLDDTDFGSLGVGSIVSYTFTISNNGVGNLTLDGSPAVTLTNGSHFIVTQPASTTIGAGESTAFTLTFTPQSSGTLTDTVTIANNDVNENPYTFVISGTGVAAEADLSLVKSVTPADANPGKTITYTLTFSNEGTATATGVVITDFVPLSVTVQSVISSGDASITRTASSQTAEVFEISEVSPGQGGIITLTAVVSSNLVRGDSFTNTAIITSASIEDKTTNNTAAAGVTVNYFRVNATNPVSNSLNVAANSSITITFDDTVDTATVSTASLTIRGEQTGIYSGTYSFPAADTVVFNPANTFKAGEVTRVAASSQILSSDGVEATPYQWQFTATSQDGPGAGDVWQMQTITDTFDGAESVYAADVDGDGDMDVLGAARYADNITWWENDGSQNFTEHTINSNFNGACSVYAADVDGDGDMDVLGTARDADEITWWENDGQQNFTEHTLKDNFDGADFVYAADVDGDGDMDVLGAAEDANDITWWENDGNQNFIEHTIDNNFNGAISVYATDVDGDGDMDILGAAYPMMASSSDIIWWENDGQQNFTEHTITSNFNKTRSVYAADVDGDGDMDVLGASIYADDITWWENDGSQNFTEHTINSSNFTGAVSVYAADVDGDGDLDVLGAAYFADDITWWENDGNQNFTRQTINSNFNGAISVYAADMDGDGDLDVLGAALLANDIAIWYNASPEMAVLGNNTEINNGDTTPNSADDTDFGILTAGETLTHTFTISSNGAGSTDYLTLSGSPAINLVDGSHFIVTQPTSTTIGAGESVTFILTFAPQSGGSFTDTVTIVNNDSDENPYTFVISGTGVVADVSLVKSVTPASANPGETITYTLTFSNEGTDTATGVVITDTLPVSVTVQSVISSGDMVITETQTGAVFETASVSPGEGGVITITAVLSNPLAAGTFTNAAIITTPSVESDTTNNDASVNVMVNNVVPVLSAIGSRSISETETLTFTASATDDNGDTLTYSLSDEPSGATIDSSSGVFSWATDENDGPDVYTLTVIVSDSVLTDSEEISITVNEVNTAPVLNAIGDQNVDEGDTVSFTASANDSDLPLNTLSYSLSGQPSGASIGSSSGIFTWVTDENDGPDVYTLTVIVSDSVLTDSEEISITVSEVNAAPVLAFIANQSITETNLLTFTASATDSDIPTQILTYGLQNGPNGASLNNSTGLFSWTPTEAQGPDSYTLTIIVTDTTGLTDSQQVVIAVTEADAAPVLTFIANQSITETNLLTFTASATDSDIPTQTLTYGLQNGPNGASLNSSTGLFSWTPTEAQGPDSYTLTLIVTDTTGLTDSEEIVVTVSEVNTAPVLNAIGDQNVDEGGLLNFTTIATDTDLPSQSLTFGLIDAPSGSGINSFSGDFFWFPTEAQGPGVFTFTMVVSDTGVLTDSEEIVVTVNEVNKAPVLTSIDDQSVDEGDTLSFTANATDDDEPANTLTYSLSGEPSGATIGNSGGIFNWATDENDGPDVYTLTVIVSDGVITDSEEINITVNEVNTAPAADAGNDQTVGINTTVTLDGSTSSDAEGDNLIYGWTQIGGTAVSFTPNLSVTTFTAPSIADVLTFTLTITDTGGLTSTDSVVITITEGDIAPVLDPIGDWMVDEMEELAFTAYATDGNDDILSYGLIDAPSGATISSANGDFSWTPTEVQGSGVYTFTVVVSDTGVLTDSEQIVVTVNEVNENPQFTSTPLTSATEDVTYSYAITVTDEGEMISSGELAITLVTGPSWLSLTDNGDGTALLNGTPGSGDVGDHRVELQVSDGVSITTQIFTIIVESASTGGSNIIFLPLIFNGFTSVPDLVVDDLIVTTSQVTVTIRNAGTDTVNDAFWVDVYFNPSQTPGINQPWNTIASEGAAWGVIQSLDPGDTLTLTTGGTYYAGGSASFPADAQVYAYVDSVNYSTTYGNVQESNEGNNLSGPVVSVIGLGAPPDTQNQRSPAVEFPKR